MYIVISLLFYVICTPCKADNNDIVFKLLRNMTGEYLCIYDTTHVINENEPVSVTIHINDNLTPLYCLDENDNSTVLINKISSYNIITGERKEGDAVTATLSMSTVWDCNVLYDTDKMMYCNIPVHVRSARIPTIIINDKVLNVTQPDFTETDYDAEIQYSFVEGEQLAIECVYNETTGMKFVYGNGSQTDRNETLQLNDFIYGKTSIYYQINMTNHNDVDAYIDCVVKRNEYKNSIVRVYLGQHNKPVDKGLFVLIELGTVLVIAIIIIITLVLRAKQKIRKHLVSEVNETTCETITDRVNTASFKELDSSVGSEIQEANVSSPTEKNGLCSCLMKNTKGVIFNSDENFKSDTN